MPSFLILTVAFLTVTLVDMSFVGGANHVIDRKPSARVVTTKYGALRGLLVTVSSSASTMLTSNRSPANLGPHFIPHSVHHYTQAPPGGGDSNESSPLNHSSSSSGAFSSIPVEVHLGVPYASPPVDNLRFMPPVSPAHWKGVKSSHQPGHVCPQRLAAFDVLRNETEALRKMTSGQLANLKRLYPLIRNQSEDCLYLNIYAPLSGAQNSPAKLPVLVFIHGGSYEYNAGSAYDGTILAAFANIVVVTINYRLGILGFLPALEGASRGNFGLMDQVAALHWIQENIAEFGGDPQNVTIMGHGSGAACVNLLMLMPMAKGLFTRAIMQSGSALSPWAMASDADAHIRRMAKALGCPADRGQNTLMLDCLRSRPYEDLLKHADLERSPAHLTAFGPVVDGAVIPASPESIMADRNSQFHHYDLMFGVTRLESYEKFTHQDVRHGVDERKRDQILRTLVRNIYTFHMQEIYLTILNEYTDWTLTSTSNPLAIFESVADVLSDALTVAPLLRTGLLHAQHSQSVASSSSSRSKPFSTHSSSSTYMYQFAHQTEFSDSQVNLGPVHGEDLAYIFGVPVLSAMMPSGGSGISSDQSLANSIFGFFPANFTRLESQLSELLMIYWGNFVKTGDPNTHNPSMANGEIAGGINPSPPSATTTSSSPQQPQWRLKRLHWPQFDRFHQQYLSLGTKSRVSGHYNAHRLSYWLNLIPALDQPCPGSYPSSTCTQAHHLLTNHDNPGTYWGKVRPLPRLMATMTQCDQLIVSTAAPPSVLLRSSLSSSTSGHLLASSPANGSSGESAAARSLLEQGLQQMAGHSDHDSQRTQTGLSRPTVSSGKPIDGKSSTGLGTNGKSSGSHKGISGGTGNGNDATSNSAASSSSQYSVPFLNIKLNSMSLTIIIGTTLLILNLIVFAGIFYQRDKNRFRNGELIIGDHYGAVGGVCGGVGAGGGGASGGTGIGSSGQSSFAHGLNDEIGLMRSNSMTKSPSHYDALGSSSGHHHHLHYQTMHNHHQHQHQGHHHHHHHGIYGTTSSRESLLAAASSHQSVNQLYTSNDPQHDHRPELITSPVIASMTGTCCLGAASSTSATSSQPTPSSALNSNPSSHVTVSTPTCGIYCRLAAQNQGSTSQSGSSNYCSTLPTRSKVHHRLSCPLDDTILGDATEAQDLMNNGHLEEGQGVCCLYSNSMSAHKSSTGNLIDNHGTAVRRKTIHTDSLTARGDDRDDMMGESSGTMMMMKLLSPTSESNIGGASTVTSLNAVIGSPKSINHGTMPHASGVSTTVTTSSTAVTVQPHGIMKMTKEMNV